MSNRDIRLYLDDIIDSSLAIHGFLEGMSFDEDEKIVWDAARLEIQELESRIAQLKREIV